MFILFNFPVIYEYDYMSVSLIVSLTMTRQLSCTTQAGCTQYTHFAGR